MKKICSLVLAVLFCLCVPLTAVAAELTGCLITVDSAAASPGETVTVAVRISDNPGFTNFALGLSYDRDKLTLISLNTADGENPYLCGTRTAVNPDWNDGDLELGYLVSASSGPVKENGILFTATFRLAPDFSGTAEISPRVLYVRNNEAVFSIFEEISATVTVGTVAAVNPGDLTGDGRLDYNDVMLAYKVFLGDAELRPAQLAAVDANGSGAVEEQEYKALYQTYMGG